MAQTKAEKTSAKDLLVKVRKRSKIMTEFDYDNRHLGIQDMKFLRVPGNQWDDVTKRERTSDRPMYEFNKLNISAKSVINQMRENRPMGKVRAAEDGDIKTAEILEGGIRNIVANADFDTVTDYAAEYQVGAGMGAWRVTLEYAEDSFAQVIDIDPLLNPFCLYCDPSAKDLLKRDAEDWWYTDKISKASFKARWPDAEPINLDDTTFDDDADWEGDNDVRIGEYWYKEYYNKKLRLLSDGSVIDEFDKDGKPITPPEGVTVEKERMQRCHKIMMCIVSGHAILEGPVEWAGSQHPWVMVYGEYVVIDGKVHWNGITRTGKDAQRAYNYSRTSAIETVALAPQDKPWMTPEQVRGLQGLLAESHKKNYPFNLYNPDPKAPGPPVRQGGPNIPAALVQEMQIASDDIKAVTGVYDASLGAQGNETSGKAINARKAQGEIANFNYMDNMGKAVKRTWEILVDLFPRVIDTETTIRILGADGKESYETVNKRDPKTGEVINDLSRGRFDTAITVGPSYATRRMEAAEAYTQMAGMDEGLMMSAGDLVYKAMDMPYAQEIAERRQLLLPAPIQQKLTEGKDLPPEVTAAMAQVQQAQQQVQEHGQLVQAAQQELTEEVAKAKGDKAAAQLAQANLQGAQLQLQAAQEKLDNERALFDKHVENALLRIQLAETKAANSIEREAHHSDMEHERAANALGHQARDVGDAVAEGSHQLETQHRDVQDTVKDGSHQLEQQATKMSVQNMQAQHKQKLGQAKANKPKPKGK
jgi:portal protein